MRIFKINYTTKKERTLTAGILADDKDKAIYHLRKAMEGKLQRINSISSSDSIAHAIHDDIIQRILKDNKKLNDQDLQNENDQLKEFLNKYKELGTIEEIKQTMEQPQETETETETEKEVEKVYVCDICGHEVKTKTGLKTHKSKKHKDETVTEEQVTEE